MIDRDDPTEELTALEAASRGWDRWALFRDANDNVRPLTPQERIDLIEMFRAATRDTINQYRPALEKLA